MYVYVSIKVTIFTLNIHPHTGRSCYLQTGCCTSSATVRYTNQQEKFRLQCTTRRWQSWRYWTGWHASMVPSPPDTPNSTLHHKHMHIWLQKIS